MPRHLTTSQIAQALGVADSTVRHYRRAGRITPASQTPGAHARYDLDEVVAALGVEPRGAAPQIAGLTVERFAPLGQHDVRSPGRSGTLPTEMVALGPRETSEQRRSATGPQRWGGQLLNAHGRAPAGA